MARPRMYDAPWLQMFKRLTGTIVVHTWLKCFGHCMPKPTLLWTNMPNGMRLKRTYCGRSSAPAAHDFTKVIKHWVKGSCVDASGFTASPLLG
jgi:hypothetical protein